MKHAESINTSFTPLLNHSLANRFCLSSCGLWCLSVGVVAPKYHGACIIYCGMCGLMSLCRSKQTQSLSLQLINHTKQLAFSNSSGKPQRTLLWKRLGGILLTSLDTIMIMYNSYKISLACHSQCFTKKYRVGPLSRGPVIQEFA